MSEVRGSRAGVSWKPRPATALGLRVAALLAPLVAACATAWLVTKLIPDGTTRAGIWVWWGVAIAAGTVASLAVERALRRVISLSALLKLSLLFPDRAPSRYSMALRTRTSVQLRHDLEAGQASAGTQEAAERLLELVAALNSHDRLTRGHSERVRAYARLIGEELGLSADDIERLNWSALLHDIGKLDVSAETLAAPGKLTDEQWAEIRGHPEAGARIAAPLQGWLGSWWAAIHDHHERWEGGGYPDGIAGTEISLAGRIVAVADAFDVMTSARSYQRPRSAAAAREELQRCAGTQFDPEVVRAFLSISVGRLRLLIGPLSWVTQVPVLGRFPVVPAAGNVVAALAATAVVALGGSGGDPAPPTAAELAEALALTRGDDPRPATPTEIITLDEDQPSHRSNATLTSSSAVERGAPTAPGARSEGPPPPSAPPATAPLEPPPDVRLTARTDGVQVDLGERSVADVPIDDGGQVPDDAAVEVTVIVDLPVV